MLKIPNILTTGKLRNVYLIESSVFGLGGWPGGHHGPHLPVTARRGSLQLWQFLIALLEDPANCGAITWTGRGMEFKLIEPEEVSQHYFYLKLQIFLSKNTIAK